MMNRDIHLPFWVLYVLVGVLLFVVFAAMSKVVADYAADKAAGATERRLGLAVHRARVSSATGCDRNQVQRAYLKLRGREVRSTNSPLAAGYFSIVDCWKTYVDSPGGDTFYLAPSLERCFLRLISKKGFGERAEEVTTDPERLHTEYDCA
jgi:hypothetical protein